MDCEANRNSVLETLKIKSGVSFAGWAKRLCQLMNSLYHFGQILHKTKSFAESAGRLSKQQKITPTDEIQFFNSFQHFLS
jgi:hypothetical protein